MVSIKDLQDKENAAALRKLASKVSVFSSEARLLAPESAINQIRQLRRELAAIYKQLSPFNTHMRQGKDLYDSLGVAAQYFGSGRVDDAVSRLQGVSSGMLRLAGLVSAPRPTRSAVIKSAIAHGVRRIRRD